MVAAVAAEGGIAGSVEVWNPDTLSNATGFLRSEGLPESRAPARQAHSSMGAVSPGGVECRSAGGTGCDECEGLPALAEQGSAGMRRGAPSGVAGGASGSCGRSDGV